ncbi:NACHT domain-containing protein, partial [Streptomyces atratus]
MEWRKKPGAAASNTGDVWLENGGLGNSGVMNVENLNLCQLPHSADAAAPSPEQISVAITAYGQRVREVFGRLDLEVLTPLSEQGEHPVVELREVFVPPLVRADPPSVELPRELMKRLLEHGEITELGDLPPGADREALHRIREAYQQRPPVEVLEVLAEPETERVVLLGDPGAGKSTLARYLALALTGSVLPEVLRPLAGKLPVVVELRRYADERWREQTFEDFLESLHSLEGMSVPAAVLQKLLREQQVVVVFDGLDELFDPAVRSATTCRISAFAARYPGTRIVVTSRVIGYQRAALDGAGFKHYMLQDLTEEQIEEFARLWYTNACLHDPVLKRSLVERVTSAVAHSRPVRELAGNPLLLTILAIIGRRQTLPRDRQGVYKHAVTVLVAHWDRDAKQLTTVNAPEAMGILGAEERLELLRLLARRMQDGQSGIAGNHIHTQELEAVFEEYLGQYELPPVQVKAVSQAMVTQLRERNFILSRYGGGVYGFVHRTFLEYLAAADIAHRYKEDREWEPEELITNVVEQRAVDPAWHEVILLVIGQLHERDAARAIDRLLAMQGPPSFDPRKTMLVLAIRALAEVRKIGALTPQSKAVAESLIRAVSTSRTGREGWITAVQPALGTFNEYWTGGQVYRQWFLLYGQHLPDVRPAASMAMALCLSPGTAHLLARFAPKAAVRSEALRKCAVLMEDAADCFALFTDRATNDPHEGTRGTALQSLAEHFGDQSETLTLLTDRATNDPHEYPRRTALQSLARHFGDRPDTLTLLTDRATNDPHP